MMYIQVGESIMNVYEQRRKDMGTTSTVVYDRRVSCDGQHSLYAEEVDHPLVYYIIDEKTNQVTCEYCGKTFAYVEGDL